MQTEEPSDGHTLEPFATARAWTQAERDIIAGVKTRAAAALLDTRITFDRIKFPFALHHRVVVRTVRRGFGGRTHLRSREVADMLEAWARTRGGAEIYAWQAVALAVDALSERCGLALPPEIDEAIDALLVDRGLGFIRHVRRLVSADLPPCGPAA